MAKFKESYLWLSDFSDTKFLYTAQVNVLIVTKLDCFS